jgi:tetratricopeptide (TPR) repeat protein
MVQSDARAGVLHLCRAADLASPDHPAIAASALLLLIAPSLASGRLADANAALIGARSHLPLVPTDDRRLLDEVAAAAGAAVTLVGGGPSAGVGSLVAVACPPPGPLWTATDATALISAVAVSLVHRERIEEALELLHPTVERWRSDGEVDALPLALATMAMAERRAGRPIKALPLAMEARELAEATGRHRARLFAHVELANAHSVAGDAERCRAAAAVVLADPAAAPLHRTSARSALASVELWTGDPSVAIDLLEPLVEEHTPDPRVALFHQTLAAAYVQMGRREEAERLTRVLVEACPDRPGRLRGAALTCEALLSDAEERDERFRVALDACGTQAVLRACAQLQHARRLLADGCEHEATEILASLAAEEDENVLGLARSARRDLARLGLEGRGVHAPWLERARAELHQAPASASETTARIAVQVLGGLEVRVDDRIVAIPAGAASTLVAALAVRGASHLEELADFLWPGAAPEVGRRRMRNVLSRIRAVADGLVARRGDRLQLDDDVAVDDDLMEARARDVLAMPAGPGRRAAAEAMLESDCRPFLPEALYEDWADDARFRVEARRAQLDAIARQTG